MVRQIPAGVSIIAQISGEASSQFEIKCTTLFTAFETPWPIKPILPCIASSQSTISQRGSSQSSTSASAHSGSSWAKACYSAIFTAWTDNCQMIWQQVQSIQDTCHTLHAIHPVCGSSRRWAQVPLDAHCYATLHWGVRGGFMKPAASSVNGSAQKRAREMHGAAEHGSPPLTPLSPSTQSPLPAPNAVGPQVHFWGPPAVVRAWLEKLQRLQCEGLAGWEGFASSGEALLSALGVPGKHAAPPPDVRLECAVCWMEGDLTAECAQQGGGKSDPDPPPAAAAQWSFCASPHCFRPFHSACLREALRSEAHSVGGGGQLKGFCPFCGERIAVQGGGGS